MGRKQIEEHPRARIVGLCDVDTNRLRDAQREHPDAFIDTDYRRVFAGRADEFDAVVVSVPDHQLQWDRASLSFTNHQEATDTVIRRDYRDGFGPPPVG